MTTDEALKSLQCVIGSLLLRNKTTDPETGLVCVMIPELSAQSAIDSIRAAHDHLRAHIMELEQTIEDGFLT